MNVICFLKGFMTLMLAYLFFNLDFVFKVFSWTWTWSTVNYADFNPKYDVLFSVIISCGAGRSGQRTKRE